LAPQGAAAQGAAAQGAAAQDLGAHGPAFFAFFALRGLQGRALQPYEEQPRGLHVALAEGDAEAIVRPPAIISNFAILFVFISNHLHLAHSN
jgi:hypothetical protein